MVAIVTDRNLRQVLTTSMYDRSEGVQDLVYNAHPITALLKEKGVITPYDGGPEIRVPLLVDTLDAQWFTGYDKLNITPKELINSAVFTPKRVTSMFSLTGTELLYNQGRAKIIDLMTTYLNASEEGIKNAWEMAVVADGTGTGGRQMIGFGGAIPVVANAGTYGGIDRSLHALWRTTSYNVPGGDFADIGTVWDETTARPILSRIALNRSKGSRYAKVAIADPLSYAPIENSLVAHQRIVNSSGALGQLGFRALEVMTGAGPIEVVAAGGVGSVMPANTILGLDIEGLEMKYHPNNNMVPMHDGEGAKPINQDAIAQGYVWTGELIVKNPRFQWRLRTA